jgi:hypothetical protein
MKRKPAKPPSRPAAGEIMPPSAVMEAARKAPRVFHIAAYFQAIYVMREKGHSWRYLADWLAQFNIQISHVHLSRLYAQEDERLSQLTRKQLREIGMPPEMIEDILEKENPTKQLSSADAGDLDLEAEENPDER